MPYAKLEVGFIRERFAAVPEKTRVAAIALYLQLVLTSAELLLDGRLPPAVVLAGAHEIGISRGRYGRSEVHKIVTSLASAALVEVQENDTVLLLYWHEHHQSRDHVQGRRNADAERKRAARGQTQLPVETTNVRSGRPASVRSGQREDSRAHARRREAEEKEELAVAANGSALPADAAAVNFEELEELLDQLAIPPSLRQRAATDAVRALAVARYTIAQHAGGGYFRTVFESGDWPDNGTEPSTTSIDPAERRTRWLHTTGYLLPDDELDYQLRQMGADDDDVQTATELAYDLRRRPAT